MPNIELATDEVVLFQPKDQARLTDLLAEVDKADQMLARAKDAREKAADSTTNTIGDVLPEVDDTDLRQACAAYDEFMEEEAIPRATTVTVQKLGRAAWRNLLAEHPPRMVTTKRTDKEGTVTEREDTHPEDSLWGFNHDTLPEALVPLSLKGFDTDAQQAAFIDNLSDAHFSRVASAAVKLNKGEFLDPKARLSSLLDPTSTETSKSPDPSD